MIRAIRLLVAAALVAIPALPALAKSLWMSDADVTVVVNPDGSLDVTEELTFDFSGSYTGAYRDIPLEYGQEIEVFSVGDETTKYQPGGCTQLGCSSPAGTFGVEYNPRFVRIVWHHQSNDEKRTFSIVYRLTGLAVVYDDVVDVNLKVWGDQWAVGLDRLSARVILPPGREGSDVRVWGHPLGVDGSTSLGADGVSPSLEARDIPAQQWVEMRVVFPARLLTGTDGAAVIGGSGFEPILEEEIQFAEDANSARSASRTGLVIGILAALAIVGGLGSLIYFRYGREPQIVYDREYEQEPPSDLTPAEVGALLSQGAVTEREFTATLFDLIRKGAINAQPSSVERSTWGGLRKETISDLVLSLGSKQTGLRDFEQSVLTVVKRVLEDGPRPLHEFRSGIRDDASKNASTYQTFRKDVVSAVKGKLLDVKGSGIAVLVGMGVVAAVVAGFFLLPNLLGRRPGGATMAAVILAGMVIGALVLFAFLAFRRVRVRRTPAGALEAARWDAFRRYLSDFSRLHEAPVISLDLWDRFLIYAIAFGVAEEVLEQARLNAPPELETTSSVYWYGNHGYTGGHSQNAFAGIQSALSGAFTPPSSGSGGGGGFSGGGGGGGGGGAGGGW